jgi:hypothetical protein
LFVIQTEIEADDDALVELASAAQAALSHLNVCETLPNQRRMTTIEIARIADARPTGHGWIARCSSHSDRSPSLSIREGRDGRTLLKCFAGCEPAAIAAALGLNIRDLFGNNSSAATPRARAVSAADVEESLQGELTRIVAEESAAAGFGVATLTRHRNAARAIVERRLAVTLRHERTPWHEVSPHALDPAWSMCVDQALHVAAARTGMAIATLRHAVEDFPRVQHGVLRLARKLQRDLCGPRALFKDRAA